MAKMRLFDKKTGQRLSKSDLLMQRCLLCPNEVIAGAPESLKWKREGDDAVYHQACDVCGNVAEWRYRLEICEPEAVNTAQEKA